MRNFELSNSYFNGKLHSLRHLCNKQGVDMFAINNGFDLNRVRKILNSNLEDHIYIENVLLSNDFDKDFNKLIDKNRAIQKSGSNYCGVGLNKIRYILNRLSKTDNTAKIMCLALEIEQINIVAKKTPDNHFIYDYKMDLIKELINLCDELGVNYGFGDSDIAEIPSIVYFDLPCGQVSWHTMLDRANYKCYYGKWDGNSANILKIEKFIKENILSRFVKENE